MRFKGGAKVDFAASSPVVPREFSSSKSDAEKRPIYSSHVRSVSFMYAHFDPSRRGKKILIRDKKEGARTTRGQGGVRCLLCGGRDLSYEKGGELEKVSRKNKMGRTEEAC